MTAAGRIDQAVADAVEWAEPLLYAQRGSEVLPFLEELIANVSKVREAPSSLVAQLFLCHGRALAMCSLDDERADRSFLRAGALATNEALRMQVDLYSARVHRQRGQREKEQASLERCRRRIRQATDAGLRARVVQDLGMSAWNLADYDEALDHFKEALRAGVRADDLRTEAHARVGCGLVRSSMGGLTEAEQDLRAARRCFARLQDETGLWQVAVHLSRVLRHQGRYSEAARVLHPHLEAARTAGLAYRHQVLLLERVQVEIDLQRLGEARELLDEIEANSSARDNSEIRSTLVLARSRMLLYAQEPQEVVDRVEREFQLARTQDRPIVAGVLQGHLGLAKAVLGERELGDDLTRDAVDLLSGSGNLPALAEVCVCRYHTLETRQDPDMVFQPVLSWIHNEPARGVRLEQLLASMEYALSVGATVRVRGLVGTAEGILNELDQGLAPGDRPALAVHPWTVRLQRVLSQL
ncbi:MAG: tetratricopeptide repeat protein [Myxococcota bacterium]|nr:tetratricopeptide repeat protein [Myxococcota bacterium]